MRRRRAAGALSIVLHTHMPYVEGFGTWPFGEEWLWEAIATSYLPLLEILDSGAQITLSLTPVLCDQLEAERVVERFSSFACETRRDTHEEDMRGLRQGGYETLAIELERSLQDYEGAVRRLKERGGDLIAAFAPHAQWTSSATHAVLPLMATEAGVRAQVQAGVDAHAARFGRGWKGGFWLPECAHCPEIEGVLLDAGVKACCVELTGRYGLGAAQHLSPLIAPSGLTLVPIDRQTISLVWSDEGYPAHGLYRDYHRHTVHHHNPWRNDGGAYDHGAALRLARSHAADFVQRALERIDRAACSLSASRAASAAEPLVVCALDTELLGHWWYEGPAWLAGVVQECERQGLPLLKLDEALQSREPIPVSTAEWWPSSWGEGGDLSTWSGPKVGEIAFAQRKAELRLVRRLAAGRSRSEEGGASAAGGASAVGGASKAGAAALRQLMAMQSSDWAFMVSRELAGPYPAERFAAHASRFERALLEEERAGEDDLRNLAVHADASALTRCC